MSTKHIILIFSLFLGQYASGQTFCLTIDNAQILNNGTEFQFDISMAGSSVFKLGSSNLQFGFNSNGLSSPTIVNHTLTNLYNTPTLTMPLPAQASFNIQLFVPNGGITINTTNTRLATVKFTITNPAQSSNLLWSYNGGTTQTVVFNDPQPATQLFATQNNTVCLQGLTTALPLELLQFSAQAQQNSIELNWQSAAERAFAGYELQRSTDGQTFEKIAWVAGKGDLLKNNYLYRDLDVASSVVYYYRLRMIDTDETFRFSGVRSALIGPKWEQPALTPNPSSGDCQLRFAAPKEGDGKLLISDARGKIVVSRAIHFEGGSNLQVIETGDLPPGSYVVQLMVEGGAAAWSTQLVVVR